MKEYVDMTDAFNPCPVIRETWHDIHVFGSLSQDEIEAWANNHEICEQDIYIEMMRRLGKRILGVEPDENVYHVRPYKVWFREKEDLMVFTLTFELPTVRTYTS